MSNPKEERDYEAIKSAAYGLSNLILQFYEDYGVDLTDEFIEWLREEKETGKLNFNKPINQNRQAELDQIIESINLI